ncbi:MAG: hypothetical protein KGJ60_04525 [Verrucomicrobiota bacterium]|nr:hypothetical protein [Verrucomicrobiota bacterium]
MKPSHFRSPISRRRVPGCAGLTLLAASPQCPDMFVRSGAALRAFPEDSPRKLSHFAFRVLWLLSLLAVPAAWAAEPFYQNNAVLSYSIQNNPPPIIDGNNYTTRAFDNENVFGVTFDQFPLNPSYYEAWNMLYYTNNGTMLADSSFMTNAYIILDFSYGAGFRFDLQTTNVIPNAPADTFYNAGTIHCNSLLDLFNNFFIFSDLGECLVSATNIINPGVVEVGPAGLIGFKGQNVDLSHGTLNLEAIQNFFTGFANISAFGAVGVDTNGDWNPGTDLAPNFAVTSLPYVFEAFPATPFLQLIPDSSGSNIVVRAVFIENDSPNAPYNVYFNSANPLTVGPGGVTIEWTGHYVDPATGNEFTNYLYLNDDIVAGAQTNAFVQANGVPSNFTFTESTQKLIFQPPAPSGFANVFPDGAMTNAYSYVNAQLIPVSVPTNASLSNPSGALTNLPGRIQITASGPNSHLNLAAAQIIGPNYLLLSSTNQFDGNAGSAIVSPYSDIYLGVTSPSLPSASVPNTRGNLAFTNLVAQYIPNWNGTVLGWSTRWTNSINGTNWDFRVEIVKSALSPTTASVVQDLVLHATNSLVLSDALNILRTLSIDSQSLTLTTNGAGNGASSFEGELNLRNTSILWHSAIPNLLWLTNSGAITTGNLIQFGSATQPAISFVNHGVVSDQGTQIWTGDFENSGTISNSVGNFDLYTQTATLTNGLIQAGGIAITADSLVVSNVSFQPARSLTLQVTNLLTDTTVTNGNFWTVGSQTGVGGNGLALPIKPRLGDLLGTTIVGYAPGPNKQVFNTWAADDRGVSVGGYTNNAAIGRLLLDALGSSSQFVFNGVVPGNALYVDDLELYGYATNTDLNGDFTALNIASNLVIYYAQAVMNGVSVAAKMNHRNGDHLRWVAAYAGYFSSTNLVYPDGSTNTVNAGLAASTSADSDGDGIVNAADPTPFFVPSQVHFKLMLTNAPPLTALISWDSIPGATNTVLYSTNLLAPEADWLVLTNFVSPATVPPAGGWPLTNAVTDTIQLQSPRYFKVRVDPNATQFFGPAY